MPEVSKKEVGFSCEVFIRQIDKLKVLYATEAGCRCLSNFFNNHVCSACPKEEHSLSITNSAIKDMTKVQCVTQRGPEVSEEQWWLPSFLSGSQKAVVGVVDKDGTLSILVILKRIVLESEKHY